jgi:hypothetical protein
MNNQIPSPSRKSRGVYISGFIILLIATSICAYCMKIWPFSRPRMATEDPVAVAFCKSLAEAEEMYHRKDYTGNHVLKYAPTIQELYKKDKLVDTLLATAELGPAFKEPKAGYVFKVLTAQGPDAPGGQHSYLDDKGNMTLGYAFVGCPAEYKSTGIKTYMISNHGTIYEKDLGQDTRAIVEFMTEYNPDTTWVPTQ